jgi:hypothetical protein
MTFCEIVHHTRKSFSLEQLGGVVSYLACCVADRSLPFNTQSTCVRLSLNLVECLYQVGTACCDTHYQDNCYNNHRNEVLLRATLF